MMTRLLAAALAVGTAFAPAHAAILTTGPGDGGVTVDVTASGRTGQTGDYDPVGPQTPATTLWYSDVLFRAAGTGSARTTLDSAVLLSESQAGNVYRSAFEFADVMRVNVVQTVSSLFADDGVTRTGSLLSQAYEFENIGADSFVLDIVRYLDGDLFFDGSRSDGGGVIRIGGRQVLFETDSGTAADDFATFVGIYNEGGTAGGFEISDYAGLYDQIASGRDLRNIVAGDTDGDRFVDRPYDLGLAQQNFIDLAAGGGRGRFTTHTLFGSGIPGEVSVPGAVPEPATWAMMIGGFGLVGGAMRRRRTTMMVTA